MILLPYCLFELELKSRAELESRDELFDVIVGDLADPLEWGPCYQLYSKDFYQNILKPKLNLGGIFVTQVIHYRYYIIPLLTNIVGTPY